MTDFDFADLTKNYELVVFDTTIPILCYKNERLEREVSQSDNALTVPAVFEEVKSSRNASFLTAGRTITLDRVLGTSRDVVMTYLSTFSSPYRVIDLNKKLPLTDIKIAALALGLAHQRKYVAFTSGDRMLNACLFNLVEGIKDGSITDFPLSINELDVYSLVQSRGKFVLYWQEGQVKSV